MNYVGHAMFEYFMPQGGWIGVVSGVELCLCTLDLVGYHDDYVMMVIMVPTLLSTPCYELDESYLVQIFHAKK